VVFPSTSRPLPVQHDALHCTGWLRYQQLAQNRTSRHTSQPTSPPYMLNKENINKSQYNNTYYTSWKILRFKHNHFNTPKHENLQMYACMYVCTRRAGWSWAADDTCSYFNPQVSQRPTTSLLPHISSPLILLFPFSGRRRGFL
jgi:hypothetical protein